MEEKITVFKSYPFKKGQKIHIKGTNRAGDWEVLEITDAKVTLRCPVSKKEVCWDRFCYFIEDQIAPWPGA
nr:hypothetical protein [Desulfobacula sp.]